MFQSAINVIVVVLFVRLMSMKTRAENNLKRKNFLTFNFCSFSFMDTIICSSIISNMCVCVCDNNFKVTFCFLEKKIIDYVIFISN